MLTATDMSVISSALHGHAMEIDRTGFQPEWMDDPSAKDVMSAIFTLTKQGKQVNPLNIVAVARGVPKEVWKPIFDLAKTPDVDYRAAVSASRDGYITRELKRMQIEMQTAVVNPHFKPAQWLPLFAHKVNSLLDTGKTSDADPLTLYEKSVPQVKWRSWVPEFNDLLGGGYRDGMLVIYAGVTGHGKSTALITHACDCLMQGRRVDVVVNELTPELFFKRILRGITGVSEREIEKKQGNTAENDKLLKDWVEYLQGILRVYDSDMYSPKMMERAVAWDGAEVLIVDYIKGQNSDGSKSLDPAGDMAFSMLDLYRSKRIPIITAGQISDTNSKAFIKNDNAPAAILYGSARPQQASTVYMGMKRDQYADNTQYFREWKNSFTGVMDMEARVPFDPEKFTYLIPIPPSSQRSLDVQPN